MVYRIAAGGDVAKLRALAKSYLAGLAELGIRPEDSRHGQVIRSVLESAGGDQTKTDAAAMAKALEEGLPALAEMRKTAVSNDAANLAALARTYRALGRYDEAVGRYRALLEGMGGLKDRFDAVAKRAGELAGG